MKSLQGIRSSAHKKKEKVVLEKHASQQSLTSRSPSPDFHESGIWSTSSRDIDSEGSLHSNRIKKRYGQGCVRFFYVNDASTVLGSYAITETFSQLNNEN